MTHPTQSERAVSESSIERLLDALRALDEIKAERDRYRQALERIGEMAGAKANGKDARAMSKLARAVLNG
jgi:hypothetical protein